jgi:GSH-dependent disulfide-bond oxidoreductase
MMQLYYAPTPNGHRARIVLEEAALPYRLHAIDLWSGEQRQDAFRQVNPLGAIPVLVDPSGPQGEPIVMAQSAAILMYVAEKCGQFLPPQATDRAEMLQWFMLAVSDIAGVNSAINRLIRSAPEKSDQNIAFFEARLAGFFAACDRQLASRACLASAYSIADMALYPFAQARRPLIESAGLPNLLRWMEETGRRPAVMRATADAK